jgi:hypothetical protein
MSKDPDFPKETRELLRILPRCLEPGVVFRTKGWQCMAFPYQDEEGVLAFEGTVIEGQPLYLEKVQRVILDPTPLSTLVERSRGMAKQMGLDNITTPMTFQEAIARFYLRPELLVDFVGALRDAVHLLWYRRLALEVDTAETAALLWG